MTGKTASWNIKCCPEKLYTANGNMQNIITTNILINVKYFLKIMYRNFCVYISIILYVKHTLFV